MLRLLHLSDIHFRPLVDGVLLDVDSAVRTDLITDLRRLQAVITPIDAILVVGDIAATGHADEYDRADAFLNEVAELVGCARDRVVCVPGNHDVDRSAHTPLHDGLRRLLRTAAPTRTGREISAVLNDHDAAECLFRPLANYNKFAEKVGCAMTADAALWPAKELLLDDLPVRIRGVNTALVCDGSESDADLASRVVLGDVQLTPLVHDDDAVSIVLCHHPASWLRDADAVAPWLARPHLLLTGHVHELGIVPHPDGRSLAISSGAVNPSQAEAGWKPAYNVIELALDGDDLCVDVRVRCYGSGRTGFGADERFNDPHRYKLPLDRQTPIPQTPPEVLAAASPEPLQSEEHAMIFRVMSAPPDRRERAAKAVGLLDPSDGLNSLDDEARFARALRGDGRLPALIEEIEND